MDKFINAILKFFWQLLFFIAMMVLLFIGAKKARGEVPPPVPGENFARPIFIDCQNYKIERFKGVHGGKDFTVCYYESYFIDGEGNQVKVIFPVANDHYQKILLKGK